MSYRTVFKYSVVYLQLTSVPSGGEDPSGESQISLPASREAAPEFDQAGQHHRSCQPSAGRGPPPRPAPGPGADAHPDPRTQDAEGPAAAARGRSLHVHPSRPGRRSPGHPRAEAERSEQLHLNGLCVPRLSTSPSSPWASSAVGPSHRLPKPTAKG